MNTYRFSRWFLILLLLLTFGLTGCGGGEDGNSDEDEGRSGEIIGGEDDAEDEDGENDEE